MVSPTEEFPGIPATSPTASSVSKASVTTLPNGLTVVSETASTTSTISITYPSAGSSNESPSESGAALANKYLTLKSGSGLSAAIILRNLENAGATPFTNVTKFAATVGYTASKDQAARLVPLIATSSDYAKWDVRDVQSSAKVEADDANSNLLSVLSDSLYSAAYGAQSAFGKSLYDAGSTATGIRSFREKSYGLNGAVLAATGVDDHETFVQSVIESLAESHVGSGVSAVPSSQFIGGEIRLSSPSTGAAHVALAFQGPKGKGSSPLLNIVEQCIALASNGSVASYSSANSGLVGVYASSADGSTVTDDLCTIMTTIPSADIITRAKNVAKSQALFDIDGSDSLTLASVMTEGVLENGTFGYSEVSAAYDAVTVEQVQAVFTALGQNKNTNTQP